MIRAFHIVLFFALAVEVSGQSAYREIPVKNGGSIRGSVRFTGPAPSVKELPIQRDVEICGNKKSIPYLILGKEKGVQNAIISLERITAGKAWKKEPRVILDQQACEYVPHVLIVPMGSELEILNSDDVLHNVHTYELTGELKTLFNIAQPIKGLRTRLKMEKPGYLVATCDAGHPWMSAYIRIAEHPYIAISDADGNYVLENVPPGSYKITMWHEPITVGAETELQKVQRHFLEKPIVVSRDVTVTAGTVTVDFGF